MRHGLYASHVGPARASIKSPRYRHRMWRPSSAAIASKLFCWRDSPITFRPAMCLFDGLSDILIEAAARRAEAVRDLCQRWVVPRPTSARRQIDVPPSSRFC